MSPPALAELSRWTAHPVSDPATRHARFQALLQASGERVEPRRMLKVTGTNGKGSVCAMLEACLRHAGRRVGLFTSPHLWHVTERFRVDGREVEEATLERHAAEVARVARELAARRGDAFRPALFEILVIAALRLFREAGVELCVFEGGVGGRSDPVGHLPGELSVITNVARDHTERLGGTLEAIARDKAGMASDGARLVLGPGIGPLLRAVIEAEALPRGVEILAANRARLQAAPQGARPTRVAVAHAALSFELPLLGGHQLDNLATVVTAVESLVRQGVLPSLDCLRSIGQVRWPGRAELREGPPRLLFDVAHNEDGIAALAALVDDIAPREKRLVLYGAGAAKDYHACLPYLPRLAADVYLVEGFHGAAEGRTLKGELPAACRCAGIFAGGDDALSQMLRMAPDMTILVTGSVFLVGDIRHRLLSRAEEARAR